MLSNLTSHKFDIVVFVVSGFTGRLLYTYLSSHSEGYKIGYAFRNKEKAAKLLGADAEFIYADINDQSSLDKMCSQTKVLISLVGPYAKYGMPVIEACLKNNTSYVDINGESAYYLSVIKRAHSEASQKGIAFLLSCGFDCVPCDMANYLTHEAANEDGKELSEVRGFYTFKGQIGTSRGTLASAAYSRETGPLSGCALNPEEYLGPYYALKTPVRTGLKREPLLGKDVWSCPGIMQDVDTKVVRRANCLEGHASATYEESVLGTFSSCLSGMIKYYIFRIFLAFLPTFLFFKMIDKMPEGPEEKGTSFEMTTLGKATDGNIYKCHVTHDVGPYHSTAISVAEAAMTLIDKMRKGNKQIPAGVASGSILGNDFKERLVKGGFTFTVENKGGVKVDGEKKKDI